MGELIVSAWRGHEGFADWLVKELKPESVVELGVDYGFSSFVFARAGAGMVYGVDSFEGDPEAGKRDTYDSVVERQRELGIKNLTLIRGYFSEVAKTWDKPIDILHIDGRHRYEDVKEDFKTWSRFVRPGGVILLHDTAVLREPYGVHRFFQEIQMPKTAFTHSNGLGVVSSDSDLIARIRREHKIWLVAWKPWHLAQRAGRKLKKIISGYRPPEF
jgi:hypothetical protein